MGLTPKQESFCQAYIETGNASEAYRQAYGTKGKPTTVARSAHELIAHPNVSARLAELRAAVCRTHGVTVSSLIAELEEARMVGKGREQAAAMVAATMGKAKLAGFDKGDATDDADAVPSSVKVNVVDARKPSADA